MKKDNYLEAWYLHLPKCWLWQVEVEQGKPKMVYLKYIHKNVFNKCTTNTNDRNFPRVMQEKHPLLREERKSEGESWKDKDESIPKGRKGEEGDMVTPLAK